MGYFLRKNIIAIVIGSIILAFSLLINTFERSIYENSRMEVASIRINATLDEAGNMSVVETMKVGFEQGMSVFFRDLVYKKDDVGVNANQSSFDQNSVRVRVFDANNNLIIDSLNTKENNFAKIGYSFNNDRDELGDMISCPSNYDAQCVSIFSQVKQGTYPFTTFEYSYKINGVISKFNDIAELNWIFVDDYGVAINDVEIILNYPSTLADDIVRFYGHGTSLASGEILSPTSMKFTAPKLLPKEVLEARIILPSRIFNQSAPNNTINKDYLVEMEAKEAAISRMDNLLFYLNYLGYLLILIFLGLLFFLTRYIYLHFDKEHIASFSGDYYRDLPASYSPAEMSYLFNFKEISRFDFSATLMDLIRRKFVLLDYQGEALSEKNVNYKLKLNKEADLSQLKEHESFLIEWFFKTIAKNSELLSIDQIEAYAKSHSSAEKYLMDNQKWIRLAKTAAAKNDFFDKAAEQAGVKFALYPVLAIIIGVIIFALALNNNQLFMFASAYPLSGVLVSTSVVMISYLFSIKRRSIKGNEEFVKWRAFKKFLIDFSNFKDYPVPSIIVWEHFLVYATSFGIADLVMKQLRLKFKELKLDENEYYRRSPVMRYPFIWIHMNRRIAATPQVARSAVAAMRAQKSAGGGRGGFGGGRSFGGGGGGIRGR